MPNVRQVVYTFARWHVCVTEVPRSTSGMVTILHTDRNVCRKKESVHSLRVHLRAICILTDCYEAINLLQHATKLLSVNLKHHFHFQHPHQYLDPAVVKLVSHKLYYTLYILGILTVYLVQTKDAAVSFFVCMPIIIDF